MRYVHCEGCDRKEPLGVPKDDSIMQTVTIMLGGDQRSWAEPTAEKYEADLCDRCRPRLLHTFFAVPSDTDLELPRFLSQPVSALGT